MRGTALMSLMFVMHSKLGAEYAKSQVAHINCDSLSLTSPLSTWTTTVSILLNHPLNPLQQHPTLPPQPPLTIATWPSRIRHLPPQHLPLFNLPLPLPRFCLTFILPAFGVCLQFLHVARFAVRFVELLLVTALLSSLGKGFAMFSFWLRLRRWRGGIDLG